MRALKKKLKKIVLLVFTFFMTINNKIIRAMTIPNPEPVYGVSRKPTVVDFLKILMIPVVLAVGLYIIMSKNSKKEKILLIIIVVIIVPLICYGLWHFIMSGVRV